MKNKHKKILIVDDEEDALDSARVLLTSHGYTQVLTASDSKSTMDIIRKKMPALVLLDYKIPGADGIEILEKIREKYLDSIVVIMLTAYDNRNYITRAMSRGAYEFLVKDEAPERVLQLIANGLHHHEKILKRIEAERMLYESLTRTSDSFEFGYTVGAFNKILQKGLEDLIDGIVHIKIDYCENCLLEMISRNELCPPAGHAQPQLKFIHKDKDPDKFNDTLRKCGPKTNPAAVRSIIHIGFADPFSLQRREIYTPSHLQTAPAKFTCVYLFSESSETVLPQEQQLIREFMDRYMMIPRIADLFRRNQELQTETERQMVELGEMATLAVHQISPLIVPLLDCIQNPSKVNQQKGIEIVQSLQSLVVDFRDFRAGLGNGYEFKLIDILQPIKKAGQLFHLKFGDQISLKVAGPERNFYMHGDSTRLEQAFSNLLTNAGQAIVSSGKRNGRIEVEVSITENKLYIYIRDNGPGIDPELAPKLFKPLESSKSGGFGLGLKLAFEVIYRHGGRIIHNAEYKKGAEFIVELPVTGQSV